MTPEPDWPHVIRLDPGLAFGSGTHPTTTLCLEWLAAHGTGLSPVLDFGCGSGILAIAAARLGARNIIAVDHDPQALAATEDNARRNHVAKYIRTCTPAQFDTDHATAGGYPLIMANILAQPLIELAPRLSSLVTAGGVLVLSGILEQQADSVAEAYRKFDRAPERETREDWVRLVIRPH